MNLTFWRRRNPSMRVLRDRWLQWLEDGGRSPGTLSSYRLQTDKFLERHAGVPMHKITDDDLRFFIEEARPASRQQRRGCFGNWFGWAYLTKRIPVNPMDHVPTYRQTPQPAIDCFTDDECVALCGLPEPDGTLMALLLNSGLRRAEAVNLTVRRIDLDNPEIHIREGAKGGYPRVVPIEDWLVDRLAAFFVSEELTDFDFLWYRSPAGRARLHDKAICGGSWRLWWEKQLELAAVAYRKPHTTRHTYATNWRRRGLSLDDVSLLLGHADIKTTRRVYDHTQMIDVRRRMLALAPMEEAMAA